MPIKKIKHRLAWQERNCISCGCKADHTAVVTNGRETCYAVCCQATGCQQNATQHALKELKREKIPTKFL